MARGIQAARPDRTPFSVGASGGRHESESAGDADEYCPAGRQQDLRAFEGMTTHVRGPTKVVGADEESAVRGREVVILSRSGPDPESGRRDERQGQRQSA